MPKNVFEINKNYIKELIQEAEVKLRTEQISRDNFTLYYSLFKVLAPIFVTYNIFLAFNPFIYGRLYKLKTLRTCVPSI